MSDLSDALVLTEHNTDHLCEGFDRVEYGFWQGRCTCGNYVTVPVPDLDLAVDELMAHAARAALEAVKASHLLEGDGA